MMNRFFKFCALVLTLAVVSGCFCGCQKEEPADILRIYEIAVDSSQPFSSAAQFEGTRGIELSLLDAIAQDQHLGYAPLITEVSAADDLKSKSVDAAMAMIEINETNKKVFDFSDVYFEDGYIFCVSKGSDTQSADGLLGGKIGVVEGSKAEVFLSTLTGNPSTVTFKNKADLYSAVQKNEVPAGFCDFLSVKYDIKAGVSLKTVGEKEGSVKYGLAVLKGKNKALLSSFNTGLKNIKASGKYDEILDSYFK